MKMIDISDKDITQREAVVEGIIYLKPQVITAIRRNRVPKGDVLEASRLAGILAAKKTPYLIPLCHPIAIDFAGMDFSLKKNKIIITATVRGRAKTGVEMEAFTAVSIAGLTIYDMCKMLDREAVISDIKLIKKTGGKSGVYAR